MYKQQLRYRTTKRRPLDATNAGPVVRILCLALALAALVCLTVFVLVPGIRAWSAKPAPDKGLSAPAASAAPTATPHPIWSRSAMELTFPRDASIPFIADPAICDNSLVFVTGRGAADCTRILWLDLATGELTEYAPVLAHGSARWPVLSGDRLVYLDAAAENGGGTVHMLTLSTGEDAALFQLERGVPKLLLEGDSLVFMDRTSDGQGKLRLFDLSTQKGLTAAVIGDSAYASSLPALSGGRLYWAGTEDGQGVVRILPASGGEGWDYAPGTEVHDPKASGDRLAWLTAPHGEDAALYVSDGFGAARCIARGAADFGISGNLVVYSRDEAVYAWVFGDERTYVLSPAGNRAQLLAAENGYALWRDVTGAEPTYYYMDLE